MITWNTHRPKSIHSAEISSQTVTNFEAGVADDTSFTDNGSFGVSATFSNTYAITNHGISSYTANFEGGHAFGGSTIQASTAGGLTSSSYSESFHGSNSYSRTYTTDHGLGPTTETQTSSTNDASSSSHSETFFYSFDINSIAETTELTTKNITALVDSTTTFYTYHSGLTTTTGTTAVVSNQTSTTATRLVGGTPETYTYDSDITTDKTATIFSSFVTTLFSNVEVELGTIVSAERNDWLWTLTANLVNARTAAPDLSIHVPLEMASSTSTNATIWPVNTSSTVALRSYGSMVPTATANVGDTSSFILGFISGVNTIDQSYIDFHDRRWPWNVSVQNTGDTTTTYDTVEYGTTFDVNIFNSKTESRFDTSAVSCLNPFTHSVGFSGISTTALPQTSALWATTEKTVAEQSYQISDSTIVTDVDFTSSSSFARGISLTDSFRIVAQAADFTYFPLTDRQLNFQSIGQLNALASPQSFRAGGALANAGTNLSFHGGSIYYPFSVSVSQNVVIPLPSNTAAYDTSGQMFYSYSWSFASAGNGATLKYTSRASSTTQITTGEGIFTENSTADVYLQQGNSWVGGYTPAGGDESATYYPGAFIITHISDGSISETYSTVRSDRETFAAQGDLYNEQQSPASITVARIFNVSAESAAEYATYVRNSDRDLFADRLE